MPISERQRIASAKWTEENLERLTLRVHKGMKEQIQDRAKELGLSVNGYIERLIAQDLENKLFEGRR